MSLSTESAVNNAFYQSLGDSWWRANDHMVVFLREESVIKLDFIRQHLPPGKPLRILDLGAGAGFISLPLAQAGHQVTAVDAAEGALAILRERAEALGVADRIETRCMDITQPLPLPGPYDAVLLMDVLEHVQPPQAVLKHCTPLLAPGGKLIYHTLNQSFLCWLVYLQIVPRLIRHCPANIHTHAANIPPAKLLQWLTDCGLKPDAPLGIHTPLFQPAILDLLLKRRLDHPLRFEYCKSLALGYLGVAQPG